MQKPLSEWGWRGDLPVLMEGLEPARVLAEHRNRYEIVTSAGTMMPATLAGRLRHTAHDEAWPAVGDWVCVLRETDTAVIHDVLPRHSVFRRQQADGETTGQVVAANIDTVWLVNALDQPLNPRRLERYLALAWESGAKPVVILSKSDLCENIDSAIATADAHAIGVPVFAVSAACGHGVDTLRAELQAGHSVALLGTSGAGKSTLINALAGADLLRTGSVREDDKRGRHTTTHRQLLRLSNGALLLDTPGMRELGLYDAAGGIRDAFADIDALSGNCRYADCRHESEPACAVRSAVEAGQLDRERLASWHKLQREDAWHSRRNDPRLQSEENRKWRHIHKALRDHDKRR